MRRSSSAGSFQQSFLDLLFGTLGAVVLLFVLISITSGPPPRPLTPVSREISWEIVSSEELPAADFALYLPDYTEAGALGPRIDDPVDGEVVYTKEEKVERSVRNILKISSERLTNENEEKDVIRITLEVPSDKAWEKELILLVRFEQKLSAKPTVTVDAAPGDISKSPDEPAKNGEADRVGISEKINEKKPSGDELGACLRIETSIELKEVGDGSLPFMDASKYKVEFYEETL